MAKIKVSIPEDKIWIEYIKGASPLWNYELPEEVVAHLICKNVKVYDAATLAPLVIDDTTKLPKVGTAKDNIESTPTSTGAVRQSGKGSMKLQDATMVLDGMNERMENTIARTASTTGFVPDITIEESKTSDGSASIPVAKTHRDKKYKKGTKKEDTTPASPSPAAASPSGS